MTSSRNFIKSRENILTNIANQSYSEFKKDGKAKLGSSNTPAQLQNLYQPDFFAASPKHTIKPKKQAFSLFGDAATLLEPTIHFTLDSAKKNVPGLNIYLETKIIGVELAHGVYKHSIELEKKGAMPAQVLGCSLLATAAEVTSEKLGNRYILSGAALYMSAAVASRNIPVIVTIPPVALYALKKVRDISQFVGDETREACLEVTNLLLNEASEPTTSQRP